MSKQEHVTALFSGGLYYWFIGDEATADMLLRTAVEVLNMNFTTVGEA